jgi:hypothetical protein
VVHMENSGEPDITSDLLVRVWGLGANGRPFTQDAKLKNLARNSALLGGLLQDVSVGEIIGVQFRDKKARVQVVWTDNRQVNNRCAEVRLVANQVCPWESELEALDSASSHLNRREYDRHNTPFAIDVRRAGSNVATRMSAIDVSGNGCYIQTMAPMGPETKLELSFWIDSEKLTCGGIVRTRDSGFGMGIEFVGLDPTTKQRLQIWLNDNRKTQSSSAGT